MTQQQALAQYRMLMARAAYGDLTGLPIYGDPTALRESAQIFLKFALDPPQVCR